MHSYPVTAPGAVKENLAFAVGFGLLPAFAFFGFFPC